MKSTKWLFLLVFTLYKESKRLTPMSQNHGRKIAISIGVYSIEELRGAQGGVHTSIDMNTYGYVYCNFDYDPRTSLVMFKRPLQLAPVSGIYRIYRIYRSPEPRRSRGACGR